MQPILSNACDDTGVGKRCTHTCTDGYMGGSITCQADGTYNVISCVPSIITCNANEPDVSNKKMQPVTANSCDFTATDGMCSHTCISGYTGGSITCQADGSYKVEKCHSPCYANEPALSGKNMQPISPNACDDTPTD